MPSANVVQTSVSGGQQNALALQGDGVFLPKLSTATRTALTLGTSDKGFLAYDTTDNNVYIWNGAAWESIPASGDSSNTQVIFNDNGILAGDAGLTYDKATDSLTVGGDLTVDTNTLKVDSANNRVGIVYATPATALDVNGDITQRNGSGTIIGNIQNSSGIYDVKASANVTGLQLSTAAATPIIFALNNVEAMRLNSTGLGVGTIPGGSTGSSKIAVVGGATYDGNFDIIANFTNSTASAAKGVLLGYNNSTNNGIISAAYGSGTEGLTFWTHNGSSWGQRMELTATGNLGIGVVPSAWASYKALQVGSIGSLSSVTGATIVGNNWFYDGASKYITTAASTIYEQGAGTHAWYSAASGNAGTAISFGDAKMTLDASGNLILLSSNTPATLTTNGQLTVNATSNTNLRFSYRGSDGVTRVANITLA